MISSLPFLWFCLTVLLVSDGVQTKGGNQTEVKGELDSTGSGIFRHSWIKRSTDCELTPQDALNPSKEPLILTEDYQIVRPEVKKNKGVINIGRENIVLACPGPGNSQGVSKTVTATLECKSGQLTVEGRTVRDKDDISCRKTYAGSDIKVTRQKCGRGTTIEIGFKVGNTWMPQIDVCHNLKDVSTLYASHKLYGSSIDGAVQYSGRTGFSKGSRELFVKLNPDRLYSKNSQKTTLDEILGSGSGRQLITDTTFLSRGHLAPDGDFIFVSEQLMTYYYVNVVPQWQPFNAGNWLTVENAVRKLAKQVGTTLDVYTGAYGVLKLPDQEGVEREIFLEPKKKVIPVPEVIWKIVRDPDTKECIVAVGHNNIYLSTPPTPLCDPVTSRGWRILADLSRGYTYYCTYETFTEAVPSIPTLRCNDMFQFKGKMTEVTFKQGDRVTA